MSDRILTPREEMAARIEARIKANIDLPTYEGAFARLHSKLDPNAIAAWVDDECRRGVPMPHVGQVLAETIANSLLAAAGMMNNPRRAYQILIHAVHREASLRINGDIPVEIVESTENGARQKECTIEGMFRETGGGSHA